MFHQIWRLSESGKDNLGPVVTAEGLVLGRTPLIERRDNNFVVRDRSVIKRLLSQAYRIEGGRPAHAGARHRGIRLECKRPMLGADCRSPLENSGSSQSKRAR